MEATRFGSHKKFWVSLWLGILLYGLVISIHQVNALPLVWYDDFTRDVFTPWVDSGGYISISAVRGNVEWYSGIISSSIDSHMNRTANVIDFDYTFDFSTGCAAIWNTCTFETTFIDAGGLPLTFFVYYDYFLPTKTLAIKYNGTQYNSTTFFPALNVVYRVNITRTGNFVKVAWYNSTPTAAGSGAVQYNFSQQASITKVVERYASSTNLIGSPPSAIIDNTTLYGTPSLPTAYYTYTADSMCFGDFLNIGSLGNCIPDSILIPSDCINTTSFMLGKILANPKAVCAADTDRVEVTDYNPLALYPLSNASYTWNKCIDNQDTYKYYNNYSAGETATGMAEALVSGYCTCWTNFQVYGRLHVECFRQKSVIDFTFPNGTTAHVYCEPSVRWCTDNGVSHLDYDCNTIFEVCVYGCNPVTLQCNPTTVIPPELAVNWTSPEPTVCNVTEMRATGTAWALPFCTPLFWMMLIMLVISGVLGYGVTRIGASSEIGSITFVSSILMFSLLYLMYGVFPTWLGIIFILAEGMVLTYLLQKIFTK